MIESRKLLPKRMLACLALSPRAAAVAGEAVALAAHLGVDLTVVHAGEDTATTRRELERLLQEVVRGEHTPPDLVLREGRPAEVILETARRIGVDLILAGALEKEGLLEGLFGSVARRLARKAPCPVLLLTHPLASGTLFRRIVISTQLDDESADMIRYTLSLARHVGSPSIHVVHESDYVDRLVERLREEESPRESEEHARWLGLQRQKLADYLEDFDFAGLGLEMACLHGADGLESVDYARHHSADLLVFPAPSRPLTLWDRFLNHPAELVMERLPCAILLHRVLSTDSLESASDERREGSRPA